MSTQTQMIEAKITSDERNRLNYAVFLLDQPNGSVVGALYGEHTQVQHCVDHYGLGIQKLDMTFFAFKRGRDVCEREDCNALLMIILLACLQQPRNCKEDIPFPAGPNDIA